MQSPLLRLKDKNAEESVLIYKSCSPTFYKSTGFSRQIHKDFSTVHLSESGCNILQPLILLVYRNFVIF